MCNISINGKEPLVDDGDDAALIDADLLPSGLSHVEMLAGRVAPAAVVAGKGIVWRAEVCGSNCHRNTLLAPLWAALKVAYNLEALPTGSPIVEQCCAQCCSSSPISTFIQVAISTSTPCTNIIYIYYYIHTHMHVYISIERERERARTHRPGGITASVEGCMSLVPFRSCEGIGIDDEATQCNCKNYLHEFLHIHKMRRRINMKNAFD